MSFSDVIKSTTDRKMNKYELGRRGNNLFL